ncbi:unnamed protein product [Ceutorhynchus assimilis]|uniref:Uncharacterized protein n=1 Tax=Ceutorhynchus assimilis TaxID=467358 RepID=A0A9N9QPT8_9CUCU|nr:unnamed protein product [Ceutorhynchus assimilis]
MPVETCLSSLFAIRFDFGVPLEDIFHRDDVHPRLKHLFHTAFASYSEQRSDIEDVLKYGQGTVNDCLMLKDTLVLDEKYDSNLEGNLPGTYFWLIRHFMGLLPLPLFPKFTNGIHFHWNSVANECKMAFKTCDNRERNRLDYDIAQCLDALPIQNGMLINILMKFIRKICMRTVRGHYKFNKNSLITLSKYFCESLFVRPYIPGHLQKSEYQVLLLYLVLRWHKITEHCCSIEPPTNLNEFEVSNKKSAIIETDSNVINPIPYFCNTVSQTETDLISKEIEKNIDNSKNAYTLAYIEEVLEEDCESPTNDGDNTLYQTAYDITFNNILEEEQKKEWKKVVEETMQKVKKVEEAYFYDDYETLKNEEFNHIPSVQSKADSFLSKIRRHSFKKCSTPKDKSPDSENSYVKYPDVCDSDNGSRKSLNSEQKRCNLGIDTTISQKLFEANTSPCSEEDEDSKRTLKDKNLKNMSRQQFFFRGIRWSLQLLRALTPRKSTFRLIESNVKYHRMKRGRSHTI